MDPKDKEKVYFIVYNDETDEYEQLEMDADDYKAMCEAEDEYEKRREEARERDREEEHFAMKYAWESEQRHAEEYAEEMARRLEVDDEW